MVMFWNLPEMEDIAILAAENVPFSPDNFFDWSFLKCPLTITTLHVIKTSSLLEFLLDPNLGGNNITPAATNVNMLSQEPLKNC